MYTPNRHRSRGDHMDFKHDDDPYSRGYGVGHSDRIGMPTGMPSQHTPSFGRSSTAPPVRSLSDMMGPGAMLRTPQDRAYGRRHEPSSSTRADTNTPGMRGGHRGRANTIGGGGPASPPRPSPGLMLSPIRAEGPTPTPARSKAYLRTPNTLQMSARSSTSFAMGNTPSRTPTLTNAVTVYGFPPDKAWLITERFQKYGEIDRRWSGQGNWMHIQYRDKVHAQRALAQDGRQIEEDLMIGVQPFDHSRFRYEFDRAHDRDTSMDYPSARPTPSRLGNRRRRGGRMRRADVSDLELMPPPRANPCSRLVGYFFNW